MAVPPVIHQTQDADETLSAPEDDNSDDASIATVKDDDTPDPTSAVEDNDSLDSTSVEEDTDASDSQSATGEEQSASERPRKPRSKRPPQPYDPNNPPKKEVSEAEADRLLHALWQRQDKNWTISHHRLSSFQHLCFRHQMSWGGSKADLYERIQRVVRLTNRCIIG